MALLNLLTQSTFWLRGSMARFSVVGNLSIKTFIVPPRCQRNPSPCLVLQPSTLIRFGWNFEVTSTNSVVTRLRTYACELMVAWLLFGWVGAIGYILWQLSDFVSG
jgi:hypothetical protein